MLAAPWTLEPAYAQEHFGWRTDMPPIDGQTPAYVCKLMVGATDPKLAYRGLWAEPHSATPSVPWVDGRPVFFGKGPIKVVFGEQALQWSDICAAKDSLHYKIRQDSDEDTASNMLRLYDPFYGLEGPIDLKRGSDAPSVIDPSMSWTFSPVHDSFFQALHVDRAGISVAILSRASTPSVSEELYPLDDRMVLNLTGFQQASGTLEVRMPYEIAYTGKRYALINGEKASAFVDSRPYTELQHPGVDPPFTTFRVHYTVEPEDGVSLREARLQVEIFPEIQDKHLFRAWDGSCYRYGGSPADPEAVTVFKTATGEPACTSAGTARALQDAGWGVMRPTDGSAVEVLTSGNGGGDAAPAVRGEEPEFDLIGDDGQPIDPRIEIIQGQSAQFLMRSSAPDGGYVRYDLKDSPSFIYTGNRDRIPVLVIHAAAVPGDYAFGFTFTDYKTPSSKQYLLTIVPAYAPYTNATHFSKPDITVTDKHGNSVSAVSLHKGDHRRSTFYVDVYNANSLRLDGAPSFIWLKDKGEGNYDMTLSSPNATPRDYEFDIVASNENGETITPFSVYLEDTSRPLNEIAYLDPLEL